MKKLKARLRTYSEMLYVKTGTENKKIDESDEAVQSSADDCDIKKIIAKYGCMPQEFLNKTKEPLYTDATNLNLTMNERIAQKEEIYKYFKEMPPNIRKEYNDNPEVLYQSMMYGKGLENMVKFGILTEEKVNEMKQAKIVAEQKKVETQNRINALEQQIKELREGKTNEITEVKEQN